MRLRRAATLGREIMTRISSLVLATLCLAASPAFAGDPTPKTKSNKASAAAQDLVVGAASRTSGSSAVQTVGNQAKSQLGQALGNQIATGLAPANATPGPSKAGGVAAQAKTQAAQVLGGQISAQLIPGAQGQSGASLGKQLQAQAAQVAGTVAASQMSRLTSPTANGGNGQGVGAQMGSQVPQAVGASLSASMSGNGSVAGLKSDLRNGLGQTGANALAAPVAQRLGGIMPAAASPWTAGLQQGLQQGLSTELQKHAGLTGAQTAPGLQASMRTAADGALAGAVQQKMAQALPSMQKPIANDLLFLGLKRSGLEIPGDVGSFAPPNYSALSVDSGGLRNGVSILSNNKGQAGLGVKGNLGVGSKKVEISGTLDPNSNAEQGKSMGVQIKVGGN
jgi:hypothetical protein